MIQEKPFTNRIDYQKQVNLIAITPNFHKDNFTDVKYHKLEFELWKFNIFEKEKKFYYQLNESFKNKYKQAIIPYQKTENNISIPNPSKPLLNLLEKCTKKEQKKILKVRNCILSTDKTIQEISSTTKIVYGKGNKKFIAEIRFDSMRNSTALFLWLPIVNKKYSIGRMRIWTDWETITDLGHVTKGLGSMITWQEYESKTLIPKKKFTINPSRKSAIALTFEQYKTWLKNRQCNQAYQEIKDKSPFLEDIIYYSVEIWRTKN